MAELCYGVAVGAAFDELRTALLNAIKTIVRFKSSLKRLEATVLAISPIFDDIRRLNMLLDRPQEEINMFERELRKGMQLILLCSRIKFWQLYDKHKHSRKLADFDELLIRFFQIDVQAHQYRGIARIQADIRTLSHKMDSMSFPSTSSNWYSGSCVGELPDLVVGLDFPLLQVKAMLLKDDDKNGPEVLLLSAPPGCGKTTLAKMVCLDSQITGNFKNIFFVTVSKMINIKVIVERIFQQQNCFDELQEFQSDDDAINQLGQLLRKIGGGLEEVPILLVLDDVWLSGLESCIHKFKFKGIPGYKILVTSRFESPSFQTIYKLDLLNHQDATSLFRSLAFPPEHPHFPNVSDDVVNEVVKACKGFPLALSVVARSLCNKREATWITTLDRWSKGRSNIFDYYSELLNCLKTSVDALDEEKGRERLKDCFLDLGSFAEDQHIPANVLLDMWAELYDDFDEEELYTYDYISELSNRNLLSLVHMRSDGSCDLYEQYVTLDDMLRGLAIHQCNQDTIELRKRFFIEMGGNNLPKELVEKLKQPLHARLVSISTDESFTSSWDDMKLPEAEVLVLNLRSKKYILPQFIKLMNKLKVLIVTNYGSGRAELNNFEVIAYISSLKRIRLEHVSISSFSTAFASKLMNLQKISLTMCVIGNALDNCVDTFPNLVEIEIQYCRDLVELPAGLCDNVNLKKISITSCNELSSLPDEIGRLIHLQSLRLDSCTKLKGLPETVGCLRELNFLDVSDCLNLNKMPERIGDLHGLRMLHMRGCFGLSELPGSAEKLEDLTVFCDKQTAALWEFYRNAEVVIVKEDINLNWLRN